MMEKHVLVVFPHPDDEAFGVAGTIMSHVDQGTPVTYICLTLGEMGRNMGKPRIANRETLPQIRKRELENACEILGVKDLRLFGYRDKTVEFVDEEALMKRIEEVLIELEPSLVITFYPGFAVHPDHNATGKAVIDAVKRLPKEKRPKIHAVAFSPGCEKIIGPPDVVVHIDKYAERKLKVIEAHESQTAGMIQIIKEKYNENDKEVVERFMKEIFWTYPLPDE